MPAIVVYPRGFYGYDIGLPVQTQNTDLKKIMSSIRYNGNIESKRAVISNQALESLYQKLFTGPGTKSMDFREAALITALSCFGTNNFYYWCQLQNNNPYFTDMHKRFLNDTFNFIRTGQRQVNINAWDALVTIKRANVIDQATKFEYEKFFNSAAAAIFNRATGVKQTVQSWVSQPGGFDDMIRSLRIVFCDSAHLKGN